MLAVRALASSASDSIEQLLGRWGSRPALLGHCCWPPGRSPPSGARPASAPQGCIADAPRSPTSSQPEHPSRLQQPPPHGCQNCRLQPSTAATARTSSVTRARPLCLHVCAHKPINDSTTRRHQHQAWGPAHMHTHTNTDVNIQAATAPHNESEQHAHAQHARPGCSTTHLNLNNDHHARTHTPPPGCHTNARARQVPQTTHPPRQAKPHHTQHHIAVAHMQDTHSGAADCSAMLSHSACGRLSRRLLTPSLAGRIPAQADGRLAPRASPPPLRRHLLFGQRSISACVAGSRTPTVSKACVWHACTRSPSRAPGSGRSSCPWSLARCGSRTARPAGCRRRRTHTRR